MPRLVVFAMLAGRRGLLTLTASPALAQTGTKNESGAAMRAISAALATRRSIRPTPALISSEVAWRFKTDPARAAPGSNTKALRYSFTGTLFVTAGTRRAVVALDGKTGEMLWMHSENEGKRAENALLGNYPAMESPIGPTAAKNASSTSRQVIAWLLWMPRPASLCRPSGIRA